MCINSCVVSIINIGLVASHRDRWRAVNTRVSNTTRITKLTILNQYIFNTSIIMLLNR